MLVMYVIVGAKKWKIIFFFVNGQLQRLLESVLGPEVISTLIEASTAMKMVYLFALKVRQRSLERDPISLFRSLDQNGKARRR